MRTRRQGSDVLLEAHGRSIPSLLRSLDDALACVGVADDLSSRSQGDPPEQ